MGDLLDAHGAAGDPGGRLERARRRSPATLGIERSRLRAAAGQADPVGGGQRAQGAGRRLAVRGRRGPGRLQRHPGRAAGRQGQADLRRGDRVLLGERRARCRAGARRPPGWSRARPSACSISTPASGWAARSSTWTRRGDAVADRLRSKTGYGGLVTKALRPALAPRVAARFEAVRRPGPRVPRRNRAPLRRHEQHARHHDPAAAAGPRLQGDRRLRPRHHHRLQPDLPGGAAQRAGHRHHRRDAAADPRHGHHRWRKATSIRPWTCRPAASPRATTCCASWCAAWWRARLRPACWRRARAGIAVRSDVDLTYLNTDFMSATGKLKLLTDRASDRQTLAAMEVVYRGAPAWRQRGGGSAAHLPQRQPQLLQDGAGAEDAPRSASRRTAWC